MKHIINILLLLVFSFTTGQAKSKKAKQEKEIETEETTPTCEAQLKPLVSIPEENNLQFVFSFLDTESGTASNIEETLLHEIVLKLNDLNDSTLYIIGHTENAQKQRRIKDSDAMAIWTIHKLKGENVRQDLQRVRTQYWESDLPKADHMPSQYIEIRATIPTPEED